MDNVVNVLKDGLVYHAHKQFVILSASMERVWNLMFVYVNLAGKV